MSKPHLTVVKNEATKEATIRLYGVIGDMWNNEVDPLTAAKFQRELIMLEKSFDRINVRLNSPGGSIYEGLAIANAIKSSKKDIHTYNDGLAASMASVILVSPAKKENRHAAKGSVTMIHNASTMAFGTSKDMRDTADALDSFEEALATFYSDASGQSVGDIKASYFDFTDHFLTAQQAVDAGLVMLEDTQAEPMPENLINMSLDKIAAFYKPEVEQKEDEPSPTIANYIINKINSLLNKSDTEMKFPKLEALVKLGAENLTEELVNSAKTELAEAEIEGVSIVLDSELEAKETALTEAKNEATAFKSGLAETESKLDAANVKIVELEAKLKLPAADAGEVDTDAQDRIDAAANQVSYNTSVDDELKKYNV